MANDYLLDVYAEAQRKAETKILEEQHRNRQTLIIDPQDITTGAAQHTLLSTPPEEPPNITCSDLDVPQVIEENGGITFEHQPLNGQHNHNLDDLQFDTNKRTNIPTTKYSALSLLKYGPKMVII